MLSSILHLLQKQPVLTLFLILGIGYLIGGLVIRGFSLGWGASGAPFSAITAKDKSPVPALAYARTYAFANILPTTAGSRILFF